jgi:hypothetical protein
MMAIYLLMISNSGAVEPIVVTPKNLETISTGLKVSVKFTSNGNADGPRATGHFVVKISRKNKKGLLKFRL